MEKSKLRRSPQHINNHDLRHSIMGRSWLYVNNTSYTASRAKGSSSLNISGAQNVDIARRTDSTSQYIDGQISNLHVLLGRAPLFHHPSPRKGVLSPDA